MRPKKVHWRFLRSDRRPGADWNGRLPKGAERPFFTAKIPKRPTDPGPCQRLTQHLWSAFCLMIWQRQNRANRVVKKNLWRIAAFLSSDMGKFPDKYHFLGLFGGTEIIHVMLTPLSRNDK